MKKFFGNIENNEIYIDGEDLMHLAVLRCEIGEQIICYANDEFEYLCEIKNISKKVAVCEIINKKECEGNPKCNITMFQGLPKQDKLDFITQKLTELGASSLIPFESNFTIAKPNSNKLDRLNKITLEACKQCGRSVPLKIENAIKFNEMLERLKDYDLVLFANETNKQITKIDFSNAKNIAIIVGSEGGFSPEEIEKLKNIKVTEFGLGSRILRCETASVMSCGLVSYILNN